MGSPTTRSAVAFRRLIVMSCSALICATGVLLTIPAMAMADSARFDIPAEALPTALKAFADQAHMQLLYRYDTVVNVTGNAVGGKLEKRAALEQLLRNTGLEAVYSSENAAAIRPIHLNTSNQTGSYSESAESSPGQKDQKEKSQKGNDFRVAQVDQGKDSGVSSVRNPNSDTSSVYGSSTQTMQEVQVTGTRIVRNGYQAPTPVSVIGPEMLDAIAATNISDAVNMMPEFAASVTPANSSASISSGTAGVNNLNLRGLGPNRTLVLIDGERVVGSTVSGFNNNGGAVDTNIIPDALVSRVDIVTGGASAAYGSDALSGVVNFVLDRHFTGVKVNATGGITTYGDDPNYNVTLTAGIPFAENRGHFIVSLGHAYNEGIQGNPRPWAQFAYGIISNPNYTPTNGQPSLITRPGVSLSLTAPGGLIQSGPLAGITFGPGGTPYKFQYGPKNNGFEMAGGDWQLARIDNLPDLDAHLTRSTIFSRASFEITDKIEVYAQIHANDSFATLNSSPNFNFGTTVTTDNPFIPASVLASMNRLGVSSFTVGTTNADLPLLTADNERKFRWYLVGAGGNFDMFRSTWNWDMHVGQSSTDLFASAPNDTILANYALATDAVLAPNGSIVCRSTLTNPNNGCKPYDVMGIGVNSQVAKNYILGTAYLDQTLRENDAAATLRGQPFSIWAGPVSLALGAEYRNENVSSRTDALDEANAFLTGNYHPTFGHYDVTEGYVETVVPLAKDLSFAKELDLSAAVRATDYSTSGYVTTWKLGMTYAPIDDVRFRVTRSRDIRAPSLGELFSAGTSSTNTIFDPLTGKNTTIDTPTKGNVDLTPERADTTGAGVIFSPRFWPGFNASIDYYKININNAIATLTPQGVVDGCYAGVTALCSFIERTNGLISSVTIAPANVLSQNTEGFDFEAGYTRPLPVGNLDLRFFGNYVSSLKTVNNTAVPAVFEGAGVNADDGITNPLPIAPKFRFIASASYNYDAFTATLTARYIGSGRYANNYIACTTACPASTAANPTIDQNQISPVTYYDLALNYVFSKGDERSRHEEAFFVVQNLANTPPPLVAGSDVSGGIILGQANSFLYDRLGRMFRAGIRLKF